MRILRAVSAAVACVWFTAPIWAQSDAGTANLHILQAFVGFNQPNNMGLPCVSPCLGTPAGTVVVQPNHFVSSGSAGLYYAVLQTSGWTGNLSTTFTLSEAGVVVQTAMAAGSVSTAESNSVVVLSTSATMPVSSYVGPAILTATTTATPTTGPPRTMTSRATLQFGATGIRRLVQVFAGINQPNVYLLPCAYPACGVPGSVEVQPGQFQDPGGTGVNGGAYYVVFQTNGWLGGVASTCEVIEAGAVAYTILVGGNISGGVDAYSTLLFASSGAPLFAGYVGPATLRATTTATVQGGAQTFMLQSQAPMVIQ